MSKDKLLNFLEESKQEITNEDIQNIKENPITKEEFKKILKSNPMLSMLIPNKKQLLKQIDLMSDEEYQKLLDTAFNFLKK